MVYTKQRRSVMKQTPKTILAVLVLFAALAIVGHFDMEEADRQESEYCSMVALWKQDKAAGIPENDRRGWPEFKRGEVTCPN